MCNRSTTLDSWNQDQLKVMSLGGNGRARVFFKQHGWTDGGRIESKYISRAADLYRQLLAKEVAKSVAAGASFAQPASPVAERAANGAASAKDDFFFEEQKPQKPVVPAAAPAPVARPVSTGISRKPVSALGAKKLSSGKVGGGLGIRKLTTKVRMPFSFGGVHGAFAWALLRIDLIEIEDIDITLNFYFNFILISIFCVTSLNSRVWR